MKFFCVADKESGLGFRLAGIETMEVSTAREAEEALKVGTASEGVGIIVVTRKAADLVRPKIEGLLYTQELPLILEVPSLGDKSSGKAAGEFLKEAIGFNL